MISHRVSRTAISSAISAILREEEFAAVGQGVKASDVPVEIVPAFNDLAALREQLRKLGETESCHLKAMYRPHHNRILQQDRELPQPARLLADLNVAAKLQQ